MFESFKGLFQETTYTRLNCPLSPRTPKVLSKQAMRLEIPQTLDGSGEGNLRLYAAQIRPRFATQLDHHLSGGLVRKRPQMGVSVKTVHACCHNTVHQVANLPFNCV